MKPWLADNKTHFIELLKQQSLPHAMIFSGVQGAGKTELARWLTNTLLCQTIQTEHLGSLENLQNIPCRQCKSCNLYLQQTHPDHINIELTSTSIGVDQIRNVSRFFEKTAQLASNQVVIIENAEAMTESAANALLKTLEEPTNNSFIILLVHDEQRLLPTIISRCRHIQLKPPTGNELLKYLDNQQAEQDPFINLTHLSELKDEECAQQYFQFSQSFIRFLIDKSQRMTLLNQMNANENSVNWLERVITNLMRAETSWLNRLTVDGLSDEKLLEYLTDNKEKLWQVYLLIKQFNKQQLTLVQLNIEYRLEKLLVDIWITMNAVEE
ncbi:DNA polymerase III subunit delta' [Thalassotalea castellviae]|uniref:DNA-directed DNA polymerase n=1 Tax=Thalassotalea castellviae TaxID=3075612 RepID=A0ABU2ZW13_9GAMM|nr:DNA polymerase III subunit delta' [Thalassotalea sp. W431]MDT0602124.1 DNA polymerase III subunit delta' [Thalassotalea sp. W431]